MEDLGRAGYPHAFAHSISGGFGAHETHPGPAMSTAGELHSRFVGRRGEWVSDPRETLAIKNKIQMAEQDGWE